MRTTPRPDSVLYRKVKFAERNRYSSTPEAQMSSFRSLPQLCDEHSNGRTCRLEDLSFPEFRAVAAHLGVRIGE